jgi:beta-glucosidase
VAAHRLSVPALWTRRAVLASLAAVPAAGRVMGRNAAATGMPSRTFPPGFRWGVSASAPQTESRQGRGESIWDVFAARPGAIKDGSSMRVCTAFDRLYETDLDLTAAAGIKAFRFSLAWPRVQPDGKGAVDARGLALYDRIVDAILAKGLEPWPTLFHWDVPAALRSDWRDRDTACRFADYAGAVAARLGDRVRHWIVLNEPSTVAVMGYALGLHAPGLASRAAYLAAVHHQNLAQGLGFQALRAALAGDRRIGTALAVQPIRPADGRAGNAEAARQFDDAWNRVFLDPLFGKPYPERFAGEFARLSRTGDARIIAAAPDFLGVNYYYRIYVRRASGNPLGAMPSAPPHGTELTGLGWAIEPDGLAEVLSELQHGYGNPETIVTEFGAAFADAAPRDGVVDDPRRSDFIRRYGMAAGTAIARGARVRGLFYWAPTDNWEWTKGFTAHFGLIQVDRHTLARIPKRSLAYFGACANQNTII